MNSDHKTENRLIDLRFVTVSCMVIDRMKSLPRSNQLTDLAIVSLGTAQLITLTS